MKLINYLYLLTYMTIINAQDDNPSGHEAVLLGPNAGLPGTLTTTSTTSTTSTSSTTTATSTTTLDDNSLKTSNSGNKNVLNYGLLLSLLLML